MANERKDSSGWSSARPPHGSSSEDFKEWAKRNPNRDANAKERIKEFNAEPTTGTRSNSKARKDVVSKWKKARPVSGKGGATSPEEKEAKRQDMIQWAKWNPNKKSNAQRARKEEKGK